MDQLNVHPYDLLLADSAIALLKILLVSTILLTAAGCTASKLRRKLRQKRKSIAEESATDRPAGRELPGPPSLPVVGSYPFMQLPYRRWLPEGARLYGEIFVFQLAGNCWVSLNSLKAIDALKEHGEALSGRPQGLWSKKLFNGNGLALGEGPAWRKQRQFVHRFISQIRSHRGNLESLMHEELQLSLEEQVPGEPVPSELFTRITANIVFRIIFGQRASDNQNFTSRLEAVQTIVQKDIYSSFATSVLLPYLMAFPNLLFYLVKKTRAAQRSIKLLLSFIEDQIRQANQLSNSGCGDATFFVETAVNSAELASMENYSDSGLAVTIFDLLIGATDTTSSCLKWIFLYLATHRNGDYQDELFKELSALTAADCQEAPGLRALITEVLRLHPPLPTAINHCAKEDIVVLGYRVPAGAWVFPNLREALRSSTVFGAAPDQFDPARFLTGPGGQFKKPAEVIPFSVGPRSCPGERLAELQITLVTVELIRRYRFRLAGDVTPEYVARLMEGSDGLVWSPKNYQLVMEPRV
ncbi:hypothetical protein BOX15_Mlig029494g1 [Macrostomum lignano]|uniref:Cytochrome P450 n=1 Tax=Macrostomum lignano TaxID=282301 RepID=A0A267E7V0_9PLAT|nr:hypothetical protein BOX15_Mlig029494g2 [Macrostomum lignano]PAA57661.1 hypothetical protein BOX15_Mlig029494g1 [Macrostomum lignano]